MLATSAFTLMKNKVEVFKDMFTIVSLNIVKIISLTTVNWAQLRNEYRENRQSKQ